MFVSWSPRSRFVEEADSARSFETGGLMSRVDVRCAFASYRHTTSCIEPKAEAECGQSASLRGFQAAAEQGVLAQSASGREMTGALN